MLESAETNLRCNSEFTFQLIPVQSDGLGKMLICLVQKNSNIKGMPVICFHIFETHS